MSALENELKQKLNSNLSIKTVKNLSVVINGYRQLGFEFEYFDDLKEAVKKAIADLAQNITTNKPSVEVLKVILYEFPELEFDDEDQKKIFDSLLDGFKSIGSKSETKQPYFSIFGELVKTINYFSPTNAKLKELCTVIRKRKEVEEEKKNSQDYSIVAVLSTVLEGFGCPEEDLKSQLLNDSKQKV